MVGYLAGLRSEGGRGSRRSVTQLMVAAALSASLGSCTFARKKLPKLERSYYSTQSIIANGLSPQILAELPDEHLDWVVGVYALDSMKRGYWEDYDEFAALRAGFRAILSTLELQAEVENGGFSQFFFNSTGVLAYEAVTGFRLIGATEIILVVEEVIALEKEKGTPCSFFPDSGAPPCEYDGPYDFADYQELDDRFFTCSDNLSNQRIRYIRAHPWEFYGPPIKIEGVSRP